jgi:hypothetical protein
VEFYSTIKKNEILLFAGKWMELEKHHLKRNYPGSESQRLHVFSHMWNIDPIQIQCYEKQVILRGDLILEKESKRRKLKR